MYRACHTATKRRRTAATVTFDSALDGAVKVTGGYPRLSKGQGQRPISSALTEV